MLCVTGFENKYIYANQVLICGVKLQTRLHLHITGFFKSRGFYFQKTIFLNVSTSICQCKKKHFSGLSKQIRKIHFAHRIFD